MSVTARPPDTATRFQHRQNHSARINGVMVKATFFSLTPKPIRSDVAMNKLRMIVKDRPAPTRRNVSPDQTTPLKMNIQSDNVLIESIGIIKTDRKPTNIKARLSASSRVMSIQKSLAELRNDSNLITRPSV